MADTIDLYAVDPGSFSYVAGQTYYNELLAHVVLTNLYNMEQEGFQIPISTEGDPAFADMVAVLEQIADQEGIVEIDGVRIYMKSQIIEE